MSEGYTVLLQRALLVGLLSCCVTTIGKAKDAPEISPAPVLLWPEGAPNAQGDAAAERPTLRVYLPLQEKANGAGVVICPGGGYQILALDHEGQQAAKWFNSHGIAAFVLQYRLSPKYKHPVPMLDAQRAIRHVRANAEKYNVSPTRLGIMGFSAGGHLASTVATHFDLGQDEGDDPIEQASCRPDFAILAYPVVTMQDFGHAGSRSNLLGDNPKPELLVQLSNEKQVTSETPPTFLFHTAEDDVVPVKNSLAFYQACLKAGVPAELHIYPNGPHGIGLASGAPVVATWTDRLLDWLKNSGFLSEIQRTAVEGNVTVDGKPLGWGMITFVPEDGDLQPAAFSMISQGKYSIAKARGAVVGKCHVQIRNLGGFASEPTIADAVRLDKGQLKCTLTEGTNVLDFDLPTSRPESKSNEAR